jgi:hypothetical protein
MKDELYRAPIILLELIKKERGIHLSGWGGNSKKWVDFLESIMVAIVTLEHGTCLRLILQLGNPLVSESYQFHMSLYFFVQSKSVLIAFTLCSWYSSSQCCQVSCRAS